MLGRGEVGRRSSGALVLLPLVIPFAMSLGCKDEPKATPDTTATATAPATAAETASGGTTRPAPGPMRDHARRRRGGGGIAWALLQAAQGLDLKDTQKAALQKVADQIQSERPPPRAETVVYQAALATQIRAGKLEPAKLDPLRAPIEKAQLARRDVEAEELDGLYAALEPAQRSAAVTAARAQDAQHHEATQPQEGWAKRRLENLTKELDLDAAQQKKIEPLITKEQAPDAMREENKKHAEAVLAAFVADGFSAKKLMPPVPPKSGMALHAEFVAAMLPLLKPEQREKLAASTEKLGGGAMVPGGSVGVDTPKPK